MRPNFTVMSLIALSLAGHLALADPNETPEKRGATGDVVCGPRCLDYIGSCWPFGAGVFSARAELIVIRHSSVGSGMAAGGRLDTQ